MRVSISVKLKDFGRAARGGFGLGIVTGWKSGAASRPRAHAIQREESLLEATPAAVSRIWRRRTQREGTAGASPTRFDQVR